MKNYKNEGIIGIIFLITIISNASVCIAQDQEPKFVYCQIVGEANLVGKITVVVDFGQKMNAWASNKLKDASGKNLKFNSMIDALNFMGKKGWEFSQAYTLSSGNSLVYHFLMKKPFNDLDADTKAEFNKENN